MTLTPAQLLAAADRVRDAATRTDEPVRNPAEKSEPHPAHRTGAERAAWLATQAAEAERTDRTLADLPRRRGPAPKR